jgi:glucuronoarabinoxylan endo-1,4-beta-xylanase
VAVSIDPTIRYQTLIGFGASLAHDEELIVNHPDRDRLFDAMFAESGFDVIRMRNRYELGNMAQLAPVVEIVAAAAARLGHTPTIFLSGGSPPASLKANGSRACVDVDPDCTLVRDAEGQFDYGGFGEHWRASLEAYETAGIHPDFVSIQSNPDSLEATAEACHLLPQEGIGSFTSLDGEVVEAELAGYAQALQAVVASVSDLPLQYSFSGPEVGSAMALEEYSNALTNVDTLAYHLRDTDLSAVSDEQLRAVSALSAQAGNPSIASAMRADGFGTAVLTHHALALANSAGYIQQQFVAGTFDETSSVLIGASDESIEKLPAYHALSHFARFTDPGWVRIAAATDSSGLLCSAWSSPDGGAVTVVLVNPNARAMDVALANSPALDIRSARVVRTAFSGVERSVELGVLSAERVVRLPGQAIVTVSSSRD